MIVMCEYHHVHIFRYCTYHTTNHKGELYKKKYHLVSGLAGFLKNARFLPEMERKCVTIKW